MPQDAPPGSNPSARLIVTLDQPYLAPSQFDGWSRFGKTAAWRRGYLKLFCKEPLPCKRELRQCLQPSLKQSFDRTTATRLSLASQTGRYFRNLKRRSQQRWLSGRPIGSAASADFVSTSESRVFSKRSHPSHRQEDSSTSWDTASRCNKRVSPSFSWSNINGGCSP